MAGPRTVDDVVRAALRDAPWDAAHGVMRTLTLIDRYQASDGLTEAVGVVADACTALRLPEPKLTWYPADGEPRWWAFRAPRAWTPRVATLRAEHGAVTLAIDHSQHPFALATYSAPVRAEGWPARRFSGAEYCPANSRWPSPGKGGSGLRGTVAVVDEQTWCRPTTISALEWAGATVVLAPSFTAAGGRARIELRPGSPLTVFGLDPREHEAALRLADAGTPVTVRVDVTTGASMPVLELVLPGSGDDDQEIWVTSHLCHGRPGANDNVSGVAAALMTATVLHRDSAMPGTRKPSVRFVWGPEYLATAAVLARTATDGTRPSAVVNLDMVGEDPVVCRAPFVREAVSPTTPSDLEWQSDYAVARAFALTRGEPGTWRTDPFLGFSDHALCADPVVGIPAVAFCHPEDPFNHSEDDTLDKVSRTEMLRTVAAATATVGLRSGVVGSSTERTSARSGWASRFLAASAGRARRAAADCDPAWIESYHEWALRQVSERAVPLVPPRSGPALSRRWAGPVNLRALLGDLPPDLAAQNAQRVTADKSWLSVLFNTAIRVDGVRSTTDILDDVSMNAGRPLATDEQERVIEVLLASGWVTEASR